MTTRRIHTVGLLAAAVWALLGFTRTVSAVTIWTNAGIACEETFENQDVDGSPPITADISPGGNGETILATNGVTGTANPQVLDSATPPPGRREAQRYAAFLTNNDELRVKPAGGSLTTGSVTIQFSLYISSGGSASGDRFRLAIGYGDSIDWNANVEWDYGANDLETFGGVKYGLSFQRDTWHDYLVTYNFNGVGSGDDTVDITMDGTNSVTGVAADGPDVGDPIIDFTFFRVNGGTDTYLDDIPTPPPKGTVVAIK